MSVGLLILLAAPELSIDSIFWQLDTAICSSPPVDDYTQTDEHICLLTSYYCAFFRVVV